MSRKSRIPPVELADIADLLSPSGASAIAAAVEAYWHSRGHVQVRAERYEIPSGGGWGVRSNLVGGLPPAPVGKSLDERRREFLG